LALLLWPGVYVSGLDFLIFSWNIDDVLVGGYVWLGTCILFASCATYLYRSQCKLLRNLEKLMNEAELVGDVELGSAAQCSRHIADRKDVDGTQAL
jgi:hypothetical protein